MSKQISRRSFLRASAFGISATLAAGVLSGCSPKATDPEGTGSSEIATEPAAAAQSGEKIKLTYSHWGSEDEKASTKATLDAFMKANPNIEVEQMYIPDSGDPYLEKMTAMAASATLPDAALFPDPNTLDWALKDMFLDLSDIYTGEHEKVDAVTFRTPDGKIAGVAGAQEIALLWYNKDMFDAAGIAYPPAEVDKAWTWDQFVDTAKQLTVDTNGKKAGESGFDPQNVDHFGCKVGLWDLLYFAFIRSNGGDLFSEDWLKLTLDRDENYQALDTLAALANEYHIQPAYGVKGGIGDLGTSEALLSKKIAMVVDGQWSLETLNRMKKEEGLNFGIGVLPKMKDAVTTACGGPIIAFKSSKHPNEAKQLVSFIMDPHQTPDYIHGGLWMPNEKRWYSQADLLADWINNEGHPAEYKTAVVDYSKNVTRPMPIYRIPGYSGLMNIVTPALETIWLGKSSAAEAIQGVNEQAKDYYDKNVVSLMVAK
jgi:multiple sugar transport system substrate-binding protein